MTPGVVGSSGLSGRPVPVGDAGRPSRPASGVERAVRLRDPSPGTRMFHHGHDSGTVRPLRAMRAGRDPPSRTVASPTRHLQPLFGATLGRDPPLGTPGWRGTRAKAHLRGSRHRSRLRPARPPVRALSARHIRDTMFAVGDRRFGTERAQQAIARPDSVSDDAARAGRSVATTLGPAICLAPVGSSEGCDARMSPSSAHDLGRGRIAIRHPGGQARPRPGRTAKRCHATGTDAYVCVRGSTPFIRRGTVTGWPSPLNMLLPCSRTCR